ncbi:hypothetical protein [Pseudaestuariivita rosea]|uniref:hypothetical protein n=1 Tax=Pseudaestuariivita rosea TaxID=2763263 RepID=UPI001ABA832A|nr:hypothetical protein [Pseudaestuariivita rosea]
MFSFSAPAEQILDQPPTDYFDIPADTPASNNLVSDVHTRFLDIETLHYRNIHAAYDLVMNDNYRHVRKVSLVVPVNATSNNLRWLSAIVYRNVDLTTVTCTLSDLLSDLRNSQGIVVLRSHADILIGSGLTTP